MKKIASKFPSIRPNSLSPTLGVFAVAVLMLAKPSAGQAADDPTFTTIDFPDALTTVVSGIQSVGDQLVGSYNGTHGFTMSSDGQFTAIDVPFEGAERTDARGISRSGDIVGEYFIMGVEHGWLRRDGVFSRIDFPGATNTRILGTNDVGQFSGSYDGADGRTHAFVGNGESFTDWDFPDAVFTNARNLNNAGDVVGRYDTADRAIHGYLLSEGKFVSIDIPGAIITVAGAINSAGDIVGYYLSADAVRHGFLLQAEKITIIDAPDAIFTDATGIAEDGTIVGLYQDADRHFHGFRMTGPGAL